MKTYKDFIISPICDRYNNSKKVNNKELILLSISLSAGDIIIPTLRRTTNTGSSAYAFLEGVLNIVGEYS